MVAYKYMLSSMMMLCTDIWVHTYVGVCIRFSLLHDDMRRDSRRLTKTVSQVLNMYINPWLIIGGYNYRDIETYNVGWTLCLNISLVCSETTLESITRVWLHMFMDGPIYGFSLEETIERLSMCFTDYDNQTNEITICLKNCFRELLPFILLDFTFIVFTSLAIVYFLYFILALYSFLVSSKNNLTHCSTFLYTKSHISGF
jgi:hypothetical protein